MVQKRRAWGIILALCLSVFALTGGVLGVNGNDASLAEATSTLTTEINSVEDMLNFVNSTSTENYQNTTVELKKDLDLTSTDFSPIAQSTYFHGTFNGNGYSVTLNLSGYDKCAFIAQLGSSGKVNNLIVKGSVSGSSYVAGIVADNQGEISSCINFATVTNNGTGANCYTGGISARSTKTVSSCVNHGDINGSTNAGGVVGAVQSGTLTSSVAICKITASNTSVANVGGIAGYVSAEIQDCYSYVTLNANSGNNIGQAVGNTISASGSNNYAIDGLYGASGSAKGDVNGKFVKTTLYDFLSQDGVAFTNNDLIKADYKQGVGYLYSPVCFTTIQEKTTFIDDQIASIFATSLYQDGDGEKTSPYVINGDEEWQLFVTNSKLYSYEGKYLMLGADVCAYQPASSDTTPFKGNFDGNNHSITVEFSSISDNQGVFAVGQDCEISNLTVKGGIVANQNAGGVMGVGNNVTISDVNNQANVSANKNVGGIIGIINGGTITNGNNQGKIICTGGSGYGYLGGIVGRSENTLTLNTVTNYGGITAEKNGTQGVGGIVGSVANSTTVFIAHNEGAITASGTDRVGGIIGEITADTSFDGVSSVSTIKGRISVGGIFGYATQGEVTLTNFAVICSVYGQNRVSGLGVIDQTAIKTLSYGYFSGQIIETASASGVAETFLSDATVLTVNGATVSDQQEVFCNSDFALTSGIGQNKNSIELTFGNAFNTENMEETTPTVTQGEYPFPKDNCDLLKNTEIRKIRYFDGVNGDVYQISSERAYKNFVFLVNDYSENYGYGSLKYELTQNVEFTTAINSVLEYQGEFNGNGYALKNVEIASDSSVGLFITLNGATVKNLGVVGAISGQNIGAIAVYCDNSTISGCYADVNISAISGNVGGLVYQNQGTVESSFFAGRITAGSYVEVGGIAWDNQGEITKTFFAGKINGASKAGGIACENSGTIDKCYSSGRINATIACGICVNNQNAISDCYVLADIIGQEGYALAQTTASENITNSYYNKDTISYNAYYGVSDNGNYAKQKEYFIYGGNLGYFNANGYEYSSGAYNARYDTYLAPYLSVFTDKLTDETVKDYVLKSIEIDIFGTDSDSDYVKGSKNNPYVVSTATQFATISELTTYTTFVDKYFYINNDIDMNNYGGALYAIGYYQPTMSKEFCATVYGDSSNRPTISNINIKQSTYDSNKSTAYIGVFACVGEGFTLKDIVFKGTVEGTNNVGGLVGYGYNGTIENCLSYIDVTASGTNAGGLVATVSKGMTIKGCVVMGEVTATDDAYGIYGTRTAVSGISVKESWYVVSGKQASTYTHNSIGSVLFDFSDETRGEELTIEQTQQGYGFLLNSQDESEYKGRILDGSDGLIQIADVTPYYDNNDDTVSRTYYARYCALITVNAVWEDGAENIYTYASVDGDGYCYIGQNVTVSLSWTDLGKTTGVKFSGLLDINGNTVEYSLQPSANNVLVKFVMTENTISLDVVASKISEQDILTFSIDSEQEYDGTARMVTLNGSLDATVEYYLTDGSPMEEIKNAGEYRIVVRVNENGNYVGLYEQIYIVSKKALTLGTKDSFSGIYSTEYQRENVIRTYDLPSDSLGLTYEECIIGGTNGETPKVTITLTYAQSTVGEGISLAITNAVSNDDNYEFSQTTLELGNIGIITPKVITVGFEEYVEIDEGRLITVVYSATKPQLDVGTYETKVEWDVYNGGNALSEYNVGEYELIARIYDGNYLVKQDATYYLKITEYEVSVDFLETTFIYDGTVLNSLITAKAGFAVSFDNLDHAVTLSFFTDDQGTQQVDEVINAGTYYAKSTPIDKNYVATGSLQKITVQKATAGTLTVTLKDKDGNVLGNGDTVCVEDEILIDVSDDVIAQTHDGSYRVEHSGFTTKKVEDKWYLVAVAGSDNANFTIESVGATNYNNRKSTTFTLKIAKKAIYGVLDKDEFTYGDNIVDNLTISYYKINDDKSVGEIMDKALIIGLEEPSVNLSTDTLNAGTYVVAFSGGNSDGYEITFFTNVNMGTKQIVVNKKEITVTVTEAGSKVYGDMDGDIPYTITTIENGNTVALDTLPDGTKITINGKVGRQAGENVGEYELNLGTITQDNNPNYDVSSSFSSVYAITKREIQIMPKLGQGKGYGELEPILEFEVVEGYALIEDVALNIADTIDVFYGAYILNREEGENVGYYRYVISANNTLVNALNYDVTVINDASNTFNITKANAYVNFELTGALSYGDKVSTLAYKASAENKDGEKIDGVYAMYITDYLVEGGKRDYLLMTDKTLVMTFTPSDNNYLTYRKNVSISVDKALVEMEIYRVNGDTVIGTDGTTFVYCGKEYTTSEFTATIKENDIVLDNRDYSVNITIDGDSKNVTANGFTVTASLISDYYQLRQQPTIRCTISKAVVTVKALSGEIDYGDEYDVTITYEGFLGGDSKKSLTKVATVKDIPTECGRYTLTPSGAESQNYVFDYVSGVLTINRTLISTQDVTLQGTMPPDYAIAVEKMDSSSIAFSQVAENYDMLLGANTFVPLAYKMTEYLSFNGTGILVGEEYVYTVTLKDVGATDKIYVTTKAGETVEIEYSLTETADGDVVIFTSSEIRTLAVYDAKTTEEYFQGFIPLAILIGVILGVIIAIIIVSITLKRKGKEKQYASFKARWK